MVIKVREEELKTPVQHKQMDTHNVGDSSFLVSKLITIPSMVNSSLDEDYVTMDETPKLEENSFGSVFDSCEKIIVNAPKPKHVAPHFSPYAPGSKYQSNSIQVFLTQSEWNDLEIVGKSILTTRQDTPHPVSGQRRGSVAQMVNTFEHQLQTSSNPNFDH